MPKAKTSKATLSTSSSSTTSANNLNNSNYQVDSKLRSGNLRLNRNVICLHSSKDTELHNINKSVFKTKPWPLKKQTCNYNSYEEQNVTIRPPATVPTAIVCKQKRNHKHRSTKSSDTKKDVLVLDKTCVNDKTVCNCEIYGTFTDKNVNNNEGGTSSYKTPNGDVSLNENGLDCEPELQFYSQEPLLHSSLDGGCECDVKWDQQSPGTFKQVKLSRGQYGTDEIKKIVSIFNDDHVKIHKLGVRSVRLNLPTKDDLLVKKSRLQKSKGRLPRKHQQKVVNRESFTEVMKWLHDKTGQQNTTTDNTEEYTNSTEISAELPPENQEQYTVTSSNTNIQSCEDDDGDWSDEDFFSNNSFLLEATQNPEKFFSSSSNTAAVSDISPPDDDVCSGDIHQIVENDKLNSCGMQLTNESIVSTDKFNDLLVIPHSFISNPPSALNMTGLYSSSSLLDITVNKCHYYQRQDFSKNYSPGRTPVNHSANHGNKTVNHFADHSNNTTVNHLANHSNTAVNHLANPSNTSVSHLANYSNTAVNHLANHSNMTVNLLANHSNTAVNHLANHSNTSVSHLANNSNTSVSHLANNSNTSVSHLANHSNTAVNHLANHSNKSVSHLANHSNTSVSHLANHSNTTVSHLANPSNTSVSHLANHSNNTTVNHLANHSNTSVNHLANPSNTTVNHLANHSNTSVSHLANHSNTSVNHLANPSNTSVSHLANHSNNTAYLKDLTKQPYITSTALSSDDSLVTSSCSTHVTSLKTKCSANMNQSVSPNKQSNIVHPPVSASCQTIRGDMLSTETKHSWMGDSNESSNLISSFRDTLSFDKPQSHTSNVNSLDQTNIISSVQDLSNCPAKSVADLNYKPFNVKPEETNSLTCIKPCPYMTTKNIQDSITNTESYELRHTDTIIIPNDSVAQEDDFGESLPDDVMQTLTKVEEILDSHADNTSTSMNAYLSSLCEHKASVFDANLDSVTTQVPDNIAADELSNIILKEANNSISNVLRPDIKQTSKTQLTKSLSYPEHPTTNVRSPRCRQSPKQFTFKKITPVQRSSLKSVTIPKHSQTSLHSSCSPIKYSKIDDVSLTEATMVWDELFTPSQVKCSPEEIEHKRQAALSRRSQRLSHMNQTARKVYK